MDFRGSAAARRRCCAPPLRRGMWAQVADALFVSATDDSPSPSDLARGGIEGCLAADSDIPAAFARACAEIDAARARGGALLSTRPSYPLALAYLVSSHRITLRDALLRLDRAGCAPLAHLPSEALVALSRLDLEVSEGGGGEILDRTDHSHKGRLSNVSRSLPTAARRCTDASRI